MTDFLTQWHTYILDPDRIPLAIIAILISSILGMIFGPLLGNANPFFWTIIDRLFGGFGDRLDKTHRPKADLVFRGFIVSALCILFAAILGKGVTLLGLQGLDAQAAEVFSLLLVTTCGSVWFALLRLYFAMDKTKSTDGAYFAIAHSTRTNLSAADDFTITRMAMNFSARSFDKGIVAPVLWYIIAGLPGAFIYTSLAAASWRFGKDGFSKGFGDTPLALEKLMGFFPSMISAIFINLAAIVTPTTKLSISSLMPIIPKGGASYDQGGAPLYAMAAALNVSLGGASQDISGSAIKGNWVGPEKATAQNDHKHLRRAIYINVIAHILLIASLLGMYLWAGVLGGHMLKILEPK